jgi:serine/threonine protein kinase
MKSVHHAPRPGTLTVSILHQGIVHRDVTLENVLMDGSDDEVLKICNFGCSKVHAAVCSSGSGPFCATADHQPLSLIARCGSKDGHGCTMM